MLKIDWKTIPKTPGVYIWKNSNGDVIYVGKAKNLNSRMKQYFNKNLAPKTQLLSQNISDYDYHISISEADALILEQNLINEYEPKFNIKIKSAKTYPYIEMKIISETGITLSIVKKIKTKGKNLKYYGPFPDGYSAKKIINILKEIIPLDQCLRPKEFGTPCLNYEMKRCMGRCIKKVSDQEIEFYKKIINKFLLKDTNYVLNKLEEKLEIFNENLKFEDSQRIYDQINFINKINNEKTITFNDSLHRDVINYYSNDDIISISITFIRFGNISLTLNYINKVFNENVQEEFESFVHRYYKNNLIPEEIILPFELEWNPSFNKSKLIVPKTGKKKNLLNTVYNNALSKYNTKVSSFINEVKNYEESMTFLKENFHRNDKQIKIIEMVDISSLKGYQQVGAVVQFKNGEPNNSMYRKYKIKSIETMDDYKSIIEASERHFKNKIKNNDKLPDVFIVDGKHQLNGVKKLFKELNINDVLLLALKKDSSHKTESLFSVEMKEIKLLKNSPIYLFLSKIQNESHRFVINFHRESRDKFIFNSELDKFEFLTEKNKNDLFKEFGSVRKILIANDGDLEKVIGKIKTNKFLKTRSKNG